MKKKFFVKVISNIVIFSVLTSVFIFAFGGGSVISGAEKQDVPIYRGNQNRNNVCMMFNVYWGTEYIEQILEILKSNQIVTTFFIGGSWAENNEEMLKKIYENGHEIANHGYFHLDHKKIDLAKNKEEIVVCEKMVESILGIKTTLFAPPSGSFSQTTLSVAKNCGYKVIMWSKDTIDWRDKDSAVIFTRATKNLQNGDLILMHPTKQTLDALPRIIDFFEREDFVATTVTNCIA